MKHIVSYSGGLNSFATAERVISQYGKENTVLVFTDTKSEDEDLYRFLDETVKFLGCEFVHLSDGRNLWQIFWDRNYMGNSRIDVCSDMLKRSIFRKWFTKNYTPETAILYVGFDWNETHRFPKMQKRYQPFEVRAPLMDPPYLEKKDIIKRCEEIGIKIPRLYNLGFMHNNCGGFCVKTGQAQFKMLLQKLPDRYKYHEEEQEKLFQKIGKHGFIRLVRNGKLHYLSLKEFREYIENNGKIDECDWGGCGCFV